ncbi:Accessory gene regulator B [Desulfotomaculum nigrificans CO-1-SRB]|uniref:Accessory gene regulator B n=1 Tax=Desulfotomaculum nigrificans (strain DSM 14880 / VKM B-2319 / CO-1-SRB) TaxID=868595 RepID=F6B3V2_DESCC|nr:accessory gene regulator B family protein [Desulfotomaculum nigrificans]AEF92917.1 Accessory gene regulator B [Desulfotomaculum nigrificans CO-1-SRB]
MMKNYKKLIDSWATTLAQPMQGNKEDNRAIMAYALHLVIFNIILTLSTLLTSIWLGVFATAAVALLASGSLRIFSGGYHCSSPVTCLLLTVSLFNIYGEGAVILTNYTKFYQVLGALIVIMWLALWFIIKNAPVETPNKPIREERKPGLKKKALMVWLFWTVILVILTVIDFNGYKQFILAIGLGIANQTFSISGWLKNKRKEV